jgi:hypothetical protein
MELNRYSHRKPVNIGLVIKGELSFPLLGAKAHICIFCYMFEQHVARTTHFAPATVKWLGLLRKVSNQLDTYISARKISRLKQVTQFHKNPPPGVEVKILALL